MQQTPLLQRINWVNTIFLILSPILVAVFVPLDIVLRGFDYRFLVLFLISCVFSSISITGGYHRLFAHRSYEASKLVQLFYLIFGAAALQGSALKWATDHRRHHKHTDTDVDPYSVKRGFFHAHIGWVFMKEVPEYKNKFVPDLQKKPLVAWQHKYYGPLLVGVGFLLPTLVGAYFGHAWGGLIFGGFARVVVTHHCTFFINSVCHMWGQQPYSDKTSAKDNFIMAFFTYGEGFHNFHHRFEADYRNGIRWYHWDPTKWFIKMLSYFKLTSNLRKVRDLDILKARLNFEERLLQSRGHYDESLRRLRERIEEMHLRVLQMKANYKEMKREIGSRRDEKLRALRADLSAGKREMKLAHLQWRQATAMVGS